MQRTHPVTAYVAMGSNLGDRAGMLQLAVDQLAATPGTDVVRVSTYFENPAVGGPERSPTFLNAVAEIQTALAAHPLLHRLLKIEHSLGRVRRERWEPRIIDLDLILYGDQVLSSQELVVPHPLMHEREFVLAPLAQIAPDVVHPMLQMTIAGLLQDLRNKPRPPESGPAVNRF